MPLVLNHMPLLEVQCMQKKTNVCNCECLCASQKKNKKKKQKRNSIEKKHTIQKKRANMICVETKTHTDFIYVNQTKSFSDANLYCQSQFNSTLATPCILSQFEELRAYYLNYLSNLNVWIGANKSNGVWGYHITQANCPVLCVCGCMPFCKKIKKNVST